MMNAIQREIKRQLVAIEAERGVRILHAVESGSRAWGFASPDSDYDCRFVYAAPMDEYLTIFPVRDTIMLPPDEVFDVNGWDIKKAIEHIVRSNVVMMEWLSSDIVYQTIPHIADKLQTLALLFFNPVSATHQYLSMAKKRLAEIREKKQAKLKHYCYVLRPLACIRFMQTHDRPPYMSFHQNLSNIDLPDAIRSEISSLLDAKTCTVEGQSISGNDILLGFFDEEIPAIEAWASDLPKKEPQDTKIADAFFRDVLKEAWKDHG